MVWRIHGHRARAGRKHLPWKQLGLWLQSCTLQCESGLGFQCCSRDLALGNILEQLACTSWATEQSLGAHVLLVSANCLYKHWTPILQLPIVTHTLSSLITGVRQVLSNKAALPSDDLVKPTCYQVLPGFSDSIGRGHKLRSIFRIHNPYY